MGGRNHAGASRSNTGVPRRVLRGLQKALGISSVTHAECEDAAGMGRKSLTKMLNGDASGARDIRTAQLCAILDLLPPEAVAEFLRSAIADRKGLTVTHRGHVGASFSALLAALDLGTATGALQECVRCAAGDGIIDRHEAAEIADRGRRLIAVGTRLVEHAEAVANERLPAMREAA